MAYVYQHIRLDTNEVFYIGIGKTKYRVFDKRSRNKYWHHIVNKAGYSVEIIFGGITWEEACQKEKELIEYYGRKDLGLGQLVNMTEGGDGSVGRMVSEELRKRMSNIIKGKKLAPLSKEHKQKISDTIKGKKRKPLSKEHKQKISESEKGKKISDESRQKMSIARRGIPKSKLICPHCSKEGGINNMKRWHFENCKVLHN
jgi:hypothetical protein